jgi:hypothetical protein
VLVVIAYRLIVSIDGVRIRGSYIPVGKQLKAALSRLFRIESSSQLFI